MDDQLMDVNEPKDEPELNLPPWFRTVFRLARGAVGAGLLAFAVWRAVEGDWATAIVVFFVTPFVLGLFEAVFLVWPGSAWLWLRDRRRNIGPS